MLRDCWRTVLAGLPLSSFSSLYNDSKDFVDSPLLVSPDECARRWSALPQPPPEPVLRDFLRQTFGPPGGGLVDWDPADHQPEPALLARLPAGPVREWARALNDLWPNLTRRVSDSVLAAPERTTLSPVRHGFVVPGGRFREAYYWDTHWVVLGLLAVGMRATATCATANLLECISRHGFVPNGLRTYYLNRSQPPILTQTVAALLMGDAADDERACTDAGAADAPSLELCEALALLDREYEWWMRGGEDGSAVRLAGRDGRPEATLNRYVVRATEPRPESWREDASLAAPLGEAERARLYSELAAGAESGWDFSSRWLRDDELRSIRTSEILPVELNAILYRNERTLGAMHEHCARGAAGAEAAAHERAAGRYAAAAEARLRGMDGWMWDGRAGVWRDVLWTEGAKLPNTSAASFMPLWAGAHSEAQAAAATAALRGSGLVRDGGVATTLASSGQQWDFPNAWPPLQQMLIEGLDRCGAPGAAELAAELAARWLRSNLLGWSESGCMHEKYDATRPGERGGGGEYTPQVGFGWTNGVVLWLLERYADDRQLIGRLHE